MNRTELKRTNDVMLCSSLELLLKIRKKYNYLINKIDYSNGFNYAYSF